MSKFGAGQWRRRGARRPDGFRETWTTVEGRPLRSLSLGERAALPEVVLVPGLGAPSYVEPWAQQIGRWTRVTVLDLPGWRAGRGRSSSSTIAGIATATASWLAATERRQIALVGHSSGAQSVIRTAQLVPDRLAGVVLAGPTLDPRARNVLALTVRVAQTMVHEKLSEVPAVLPFYLRGGPAWFRLVWSAITDRPEDQVGRLNLPVMVMTGEQDRLASPAWAYDLAGLMAGRSLILPGAHNNCFTFPGAANIALRKAVLDWVDRPS